MTYFLSGTLVWSTLLNINNAGSVASNLDYTLRVAFPMAIFKGISKVMNPNYLFLYV